MDPSSDLPEMSAARSSDLGQLGEYRLLEKLGEGGMGVVYRAVHTELDRIVAVKVLGDRWARDERAIPRFKREMRAAGRLEHPHIVHALDARQVGDTHFLVTEFVDGLDLADLVGRVGPLSCPDACEVVRQAALGLAYIHQHGLVHRDIKPSNLMVTCDGIVKILDLGLARFHAVSRRSTDVTQDGQALGTPDYMAPEQTSDSRVVDIRADLYSLGCTLFFLLCGRPPFVGPEYRTPYEKMAAHVNLEAPPIRKIRADVPKRVVLIIERLLAKDPDQRYATPSEVAEDVGDFTPGHDLQGLHAEATGNPRTSPPGQDTTQKALPQPASRKKRKSGLRILGALTLMAMIVAGGLLAYFAYDHRPAESPVVSPPAALPSAAASAADSEVPGWIVLSWTLEGLGKPDLWLFRADGGGRKQVTDDPRVFDVHPCFSPDGRAVAYARGVDSEGANSIWICSVSGADARELVAATSPSERLLAPVWLSETQIGYSRDPERGRRPDMEFWVVDLEQNSGPELLFRFQDLPTRGNGIVTSASAHGERLAVVAQDGLLWTTADVYVSDRQGRILATVWQDDPDDRKDARALLTRDGKRIAWHHNFTRGLLAERFYYGVGMARRDENGQWQTRLQPRHDEFVTPLAWGPDSDHLLCARVAADTQNVTFLLVDDQFNPQRDLFTLEVHGWRPGQRDFARLADWAIIPEDIAQRW
jgi:serine/threonine protein kinase